MFNVSSSQHLYTHCIAAHAASQAQLGMSEQRIEGYGVQFQGELPFSDVVSISNEIGQIEKIVKKG